MARANLVFVRRYSRGLGWPPGDFRHEAVLHEAMAWMAAFGASFPFPLAPAEVG
jgi:hypothetical protein